MRSWIIRSFICWTALVAAAIFCLAHVALAESPGAHKPVLKVDVANPTADKPQSKLWFARGTWWAWLPNRDGSSIWRRTSDGWRRTEALDHSLRELPGRADVWQAGDTVCAVLVDGRRLAVVTLRYSEESDAYALVGQPARFEVTGGAKDEVIETATITYDSRGRSWIAYPWRRRMWVRAALDADSRKWTEPIAVSDEAGADDICAIVKLPSAIGLAWSDQANDTMNYRLHKDDADVETWEAAEVIERGSHNADDHISAKVSPGGAVILATKNSVDRVGEAQLVLRVRHPNGRWENLPYAPKESRAEPSRPLVLLGGDPTSLLLFHTLYGRKDNPQQKQRNTIVWQSANLENLNATAIATPSQLLIDPGVAVNNVTGCKGMLPAGVPWIVLASDAAGNVYEGRVDSTQIRGAATSSVSP